MPYKLLVTDLDGTLLDAEHRVTARIASACRALQTAGIHLTFATGRTWAGTRPLAEALGITAPIIVYQGALARRVAAPTPLWHDPIPEESARAILGWLDGQQARASVCQGDEMVLANPHPSTVSFLAHAGVVARIVDRLQPELREAPTRIALYCEPEQAITWESRLLEAFGPTLRIGRSLPHLVEITHPRASKGQALTRLAAAMGVGVEEMIACGDNFNDADMIATAGLGVVMSDAPEAIRQTAGIVIERAETDGLAAFFEAVAAGEI
jgi:Cof subfamily protein (haloacid dehalogenase superfamily)